MLWNDAFVQQFHVWNWDKIRRKLLEGCRLRQRDLPMWWRAGGRWCMVAVSKARWEYSTDMLLWPQIKDERRKTEKMKRREICEFVRERERREWAYRLEMFSSAPILKSTKIAAPKPHENRKRVREWTWEGFSCEWDRKWEKNPKYKITREKPTWSWD